MNTTTTTSLLTFTPTFRVLVCLFLVAVSLFPTVLVLFSISLFLHALDVGVLCRHQDLGATSRLFRHVLESGHGHGFALCAQNKPVNLQYNTQATT